MADIIDIDLNSLIELEKLVYSNDREVCGNFVVSSNKLSIDKNTLSTTEEGVSEKRKMCQHKSYSPFIFHTHPFSSYPFPSSDDITKVIKNSDKIQKSFIFTIWGIWVISLAPETRQKWGKKLSDPVEKKKLEDVIKKNYGDMIIINSKLSDEERVIFKRKTKLLHEKFIHHKKGEMTIRDYVFQKTKELADYLVLDISLVKAPSL